MDIVGAEIDLGGGEVTANVGKVLEKRDSTLEVTGEGEDKREQRERGRTDGRTRLGGRAGRSTGEKSKGGYCRTRIQMQEQVIPFI